MRTPVEVQIWRLSVLFVVGAATDLLFQSLRAFRAVFRPKRLGRHLLDAVVALVLLTGLGATVFIVNWGELRMYVPLSLLAGVFTTHALVGGVVYRKTFRLFSGTKRGLAWGQRRIVQPTREVVQRTALRLKSTLFPPVPPDPSAPPDAEEPPECPPEDPPEDAGPDRSLPPPD
jgi:hypothetical protein